MEAYEEGVIIESLDVTESVGSSGCWFRPGTWNVAIEFSPKWKLFRVRAIEAVTGARIPAFDRSWDQKTLAQARKRAMRLAANIEGSMFPFDWKARAKKHGKP